MRANWLLKLLLIKLASLWYVPLSRPRRRTSARHVSFNHVATTTRCPARSPEHQPSELWPLQYSIGMVLYTDSSTIYGCLVEILDVNLDIRPLISTFLAVREIDLLYKKTGDSNPSVTLLMDGFL